MINDSELKMIGVIDKNGVSGSEWKWNLNQEEDIITKSFQNKVEFDRPVGLVLILDRQRGSSSSGEFFANLFTSHTAATDQVGKFGRAKNLGDFSRYQTIGSFLSSPPLIDLFWHTVHKFKYFCIKMCFLFLHAYSQIKNIATGKMSPAITSVHFFLTISTSFAFINISLNYFLQ